VWSLAKLLRACCQRHACVMPAMLTELLPTGLAGTALTLSSTVVGPLLVATCVTSATSLHGKAAASATATVHACQEQVRRGLQPHTVRPRGCPWSAGCGSSHCCWLWRRLCCLNDWWTASRLQVHAFGAKSCRSALAVGCAVTPCSARLHCPLFHPQVAPHVTSATSLWPTADASATTTAPACPD
jgi:hypothetical protein